MKGGKILYTTAAGELYGRGKRATRLEDLEELVV